MVKLLGYQKALVLPQTTTDIWERNENNPIAAERRGMERGMARGTERGMERTLARKYGKIDKQRDREMHTVQVEDSMS